MTIVYKFQIKGSFGNKQGKFHLAFSTWILDQIKQNPYDSNWNKLMFHLLLYLVQFFPTSDGQLKIEIFFSTKIDFDFFKEHLCMNKLCTIVQSLITNLKIFWKEKHLKGTRSWTWPLVTESNESRHRFHKCIEFQTRIV